MPARSSAGPRLLLCGPVALLLVLALPAGARGQEGSAPAVRRAAERELASRFSESAAKMEVRVRRVQSQALSGDSTAQLRLDFPDREQKPEGTTQVQIQTRDAGRWADSGWALLEVAHYDSVMTTRSRIRRGKTVTPAHVEAAWVEVTDVNGEPLRASDFRSRVAEGTLVATRLLQAGETLRRGEVRRPHAADTGTAIEMRYTRGRFLLRLACKAREPGGLKEVIRVYCPDTQATYRARITGTSTARWIETL